MYLLQLSEQPAEEGTESWGASGKWPRPRPIMLKFLPIMLLSIV